MCRGAGTRGGHPAVGGARRQGSRARGGGRSRVWCGVTWGSAARPFRRFGVEWREACAQCCCASGVGGKGEAEKRNRGRLQVGPACKGAKEKRWRGEGWAGWFVVCWAARRGLRQAESGPWPGMEQAKMASQAGPRWF